MATTSTIGLPITDNNRKRAGLLHAEYDAIFSKLKLRSTPNRNRDLCVCCARQQHALVCSGTMILA